MNRTKIEWCDYTWNPIKGYCPGNCEYCYAHRLYDRFGWDKTLRLDEDELRRIETLSGSKRIFVGSTIEMYHPKIPRDWLERIFTVSKLCPDHTFITLSKQTTVQHLIEFPMHWWIGVSTTGKFTYLPKMPWNNYNVHFVCFEPLLQRVDMLILECLHRYDWIIIGGLTPRPRHEKKWIDEVLQYAREADVPVFIKDNAHYPVEYRMFPRDRYGSGR